MIAPIPYGRQDVAPEDPWFEAANLLTVRGIWQAAADDVFFAPAKIVTQEELSGALARLGRALLAPKPWTPPSDLAPATGTTWGTLHAWLSALQLPPDKGLARQKDQPLTRGECVRFLWAALQQAGEWQPGSSTYLAPGNDSDGDGIADLDDALPFDHHNRNLPDRLLWTTP